MKSNFFTKIFMVLIIIQLAFGSAFSVFADEDDDGVVIDKNAAAPQLVLANGPVFEVNAGEVNNVIFKIRNASGYTAKSVIVQADLSSLDSNPFKMDFVNKSNDIVSIAGRGYKNSEVAFTVDKTAENKTYSMKLKYVYFNGYGIKFSGEDTFYLKVNSSSKGNANFTVEDFKLSTETLAAGGTSVLSATLKNSGFIDMNDIEVTLDGLAPDGISIHNGLSIQKVGKVRTGERKSFSFNIAASDSMDSGNYPITIQVKYKDEENKSVGPVESKFFVSVGSSGSALKPSLEIKNLQEPNGRFGVNQSAPIAFDVVNTGENTAKNIKITAAGVGENSVVPKSSSIQTLKELAPGASKSFKFMFAGTSASKSQNYSVEFTVEYEDGTRKDGVNNVVSFKQYAGMDVSNPEADKTDDKDDKKSTPKIIVSEYQCDPLIVMAGEEFDLTMTFLNTHSEKAVKNVKMFLTLAEETSTDTEKTGNIFTPVDSSNTFYFDSISPKSTANKKMRLYVVPDAQPKTYTLTVNFEYEDADKNEFKATELLGINVKQSTKLDTGDIYVPETIEAGMPVTLNFDFYNTGKVQVNNLMIKLEGEKIETQNKSTYFGNLESGNSDYYEGTFSINEEGEANVKVIISYDDPSGEHKEDVHEFTTMVTAPAPMETDEMLGPDGMPIDDKADGNNINVGLVVGVVAVLVVIGVVVTVVLKKRKKSKEDEFLRSYDDIDKKL